MGCARPDFRENNGYIVPKRIMKQFLFPSQETQLHHATETLCHAIHGLNIRWGFCENTKWFELVMLEMWSRADVFALIYIRYDIKQITYVVPYSILSTRGKLLSQEKFYFILFVFLIRMSSP